MSERHSRGVAHHGNVPGNTGSGRNGMAIPGGYVRSTADADREREVAERVNAIRASLGLPPPEPPREFGTPRKPPAAPAPVPPSAPAEPVAEFERCEDCGYLMTAAGHKVMCGGAA